jgi:hypothetical protein
MIGQILPNNNKRCYSNFAPTFREVDTPSSVNSMQPLTRRVRAIRACLVIVGLGETTRSTSKVALGMGNREEKEPFHARHTPTPVGPAGWPRARWYVLLHAAGAGGVGCSSTHQLGHVNFVKIFNSINSITFVLFDKYCLIVDQLGSKDSFRDFQLNCVISYFLPTFNTLCKRLKIDVMERVKKLYLLGPSVACHVFLFWDIIPCPRVYCR